MELLSRLERKRMEFGRQAAVDKLRLLERLGKSRMPGAEVVRRLHEVLCFMRAYPDDARVLRQVTRMLTGFSGRADLRRHAAALADSGIAGTRLCYPFYADTAAWLARRFPEELGLDWDSIGDPMEQHVLDRLDLLLSYCEVVGLDGDAQENYSLRDWLGHLKGPKEGEGAFLARRFAALKADPFLRESYYDDIGLPLALSPGPKTPSRTLAHARLAGLDPVFQAGPLNVGRPEMRAVLRRKPRVRHLSTAEGARMVELARDAMVTRKRDLDLFVYGDPRDVSLIECEDGLCFVAIGLQPERRLPLEAIYGFLTLKNGVPIGYVLNSALFGSAEVAYNVFEAFRGGEAAHVYGWVLSAVRHLFGVDSFTIYPYQLGHENEEGLTSGAWWFYQKLGFRPREKKTLALMRSELARQKRNPAHRSSLSTLRRLVTQNMYYSMGRARRDVIGSVSMGAIGMAAVELLAQRFGADRERGERVCSKEAARLFGLGSFKGWSVDERRAWTRFAPMLLACRGVASWSREEKRSAIEAIRAKGGRREVDFVHAFDGHRKLRAAFLALSRRRGKKN